MRIAPKTPQPPRKKTSPAAKWTAIGIGVYAALLFLSGYVKNNPDSPLCNVPGIDCNGFE